MDRVIFIVNKGRWAWHMKGGSTIRAARIVTKKVELVEYSEDPSAFLGNVLNSDMINEIKINNRFDGSRQAVVVVDSKKKGIVVGKEGRNAEKARILAKRYFQISNVMIVSEDHAQNF